MATRKRKSLAEIEAQRARIVKSLATQAYNAKNTRERKMYQSRLKRAAATADRYIGNIKGMRSYSIREGKIKDSMDGKDWYKGSEIDKRESLRNENRNKGVSQNTYMGLNKG